MSQPIEESSNFVFHIKVNVDIKSCLKLVFFHLLTHTERKDSNSVISSTSLLDKDAFTDEAETLCQPELHCLLKLIWAGATAIIWISHAWSLSILSAPCGTFLPMMKCYCCWCQTFSLYQSPSWQPSLFRKTWDNFKVRTFNTRSEKPDFFPIHCSTTSFLFQHDSQSITSSSSTAVEAIEQKLHLLGPQSHQIKRNI